MLSHRARRLAIASTLSLLSALACDLWAQPRDVRVGVYDNLPKIALSHDGQPSGIFGELLVEMARQQDWRLRVVPCDWQTCLSLLQRGELDLLPDVAYSEERAKRFDFHHIPALYSWSQLYSRKNLELLSPEDLKDRRIAVLEGSIQQDYLLGFLPSSDLRATLLPVASLDQGFALVSSGLADAAVANKQFGDRYAGEYGLFGTPLMFPPLRMFYATRKGANADLLGAIDQQLRAWEQAPDSFYRQTLQRWKPEGLRTQVPPAIWWGLAGLIALLLTTFGGAMLLRRQVAEKTWHLRASEARLNTILDSVEAYIYIKDQQLRYQYANRKVCELFGKRPEEVVGHTDEEFFDAATAHNLQNNDRRVLELGERVEKEETNHNLKTDGERTFLSVKLPLRHPDGSIYALCGISTDITEHKRNRDEIHRLAFYDPLTGLANRRLLLDRLQHALVRRSRRCGEGALLFIDLDNFKDLNDTFGHDVGDQLLQLVAQRLGGQARTEDTVARLGGDEFVVMIEDLSARPDEALAQIENVASKTLQALAEPYTLLGRQHICTASLGIALLSESRSSVEDLLKRADLAMYEAKSAGRNTLRFFNPEMQARITVRTTLESELRKGLQHNDFVLHYQPQVDHRGRLLGAEVLVRWQHPSRGLVPPMEFIPAAERCGLILPLGQWVLRSACQQLAAWARNPEWAGLSLAVNVSARQFHHPDFVNEVLAVLEETGANPLRLELELTESLLVEDVDALIVKMNQLKNKGIQFSLDDFGTGYSSLSQLKRLPLNQLKIDRSFVHDLQLSSNDAIIVRTIIALANSLELAVIAEGVETPEQRDALLQLGCHRFQGYLFGAPRVVGHLQDWSSAARLGGAPPLTPDAIEP
ncbi:EAL domain-containing protein [Pseudomonas benzenivorans]|uniref:EAL domain-containing protein n=1 Tax=Pseudomonas benzenivorans TaxID=556533 RepID=A0ABY5H441_9PSED|nr:EAL domain-containing protein [Pseudomonas benzenivorans]UTW06551.1 EAL domain-containing protein [Pseudomonas benzenivorans]